MATGRVLVEASFAMLTIASRISVRRVWWFKHGGNGCGSYLLSPKHIIEACLSGFDFFFNLQNCAFLGTLCGV